MKLVTSESKRALVREAAVSEIARKQLREELLPYVQSATKAFMQSRGIPENRESKLVEIGMEPFDRVFNIYLKNASDHNDEVDFFAYYIWWMRQAIVAFLEVNP